MGKWVSVAALAGIACTFNSTVPGGADLGGSSGAATVGGDTQTQTLPPTGSGDAATAITSLVTDTTQDTSDDDTAPSSSGVDDDGQWLYRRRLSFINVPEALEGFVARVSLNAERIDFAACHEDGHDLRFFAGDERLAYDIEAWDAEAERAEVWVSVPELGPDNDEIWMHYGNPDAASGENKDDTWDKSFVAVLHLHRGVDDSSGEGNDGDDQGTENATGRIAAARHFDGTAYVDLPPGLSSLQSGAVSLLFRTPTPTTAKFMFYGAAVPDADGYGPEPEVHLHISRNGANETEFDFAVPWGDGGVDTEVEIQAEVGDDGWHYAYASWETAVAADGEIALAIDDERAAVALPPTPGFEFDEIIRLGRPGADTRSYDGDLDEVRLHAAPRTPAWIALDTRSVRDALIEYGPQEEL